MERLTSEHSYAHLALIAATGAGKTSTFVIPNLLTLDNCSFLVTDPSGEIFRSTSGALRQKGYEIAVFDAEDPSRSLGFNPLHDISTYQEFSEMANVIIDAAGMADHSNPISELLT